MDSAAEARAHLQRGVDALAERVEKAKESNARLLSHRESVMDENESVRVEIDPSGRLTNIEFGANAFNLTAEQLSRVVMETFAEAQRRSANWVGELANDTWGADSDTAQQIHQQAVDQIIELPEEDDDDEPTQRSARWGR